MTFPGAADRTERSLPGSEGSPRADIEELPRILGLRANAHRRLKRLRCVSESQGSCPTFILRIPGLSPALYPQSVSICVVSVCASPRPGGDPLNYAPVSFLGVGCATGSGLPIGLQPKTRRPF